MKLRALVFVILLATMAAATPELLTCPGTIEGHRVPEGWTPRSELPTDSDALRLVSLEVLDGHQIKCSYRAVRKSVSRTPASELVLERNSALSCVRESAATARCD